MHCLLKKATFRICMFFHMTSLPAWCVCSMLFTTQLVPKPCFPLKHDTFPGYQNTIFHVIKPGAAIAGVVCCLLISLFWREKRDCIFAMKPQSVRHFLFCKKGYSSWFFQRFFGVKQTINDNNDQHFFWFSDVLYKKKQFVAKPQGGKSLDEVKFLATENPRVTFGPPKM